MQFQVGDRVRHQTRNRPHDSFGVGTVTKVEHLDNYCIVVTVQFDSDGDVWEFSDDWRISSCFKVFEDYMFIDFTLGSLTAVSAERRDGDDTGR